MAAETTIASMVAKDIVGAEQTFFGSGKAVMKETHRLAAEMDPKKTGETNYGGLLRKGATTVPDRRKDVAEKIDGIGTRDPDTGDVTRTDEQKDLVTEAQKHGEPAATFAHEGYDALTNEQKKTYRATLESRLNQRDGFSGILAGKTRDQKNQILDKMLREQPGLRTSLDQELESIQNDPRFQFENDTAVRTAEQSLQTAKDAAATAADRLKTVQDELTMVRQRLEDFKPAEGGNPAGASAQEIENLRDVDRRNLEIPQMQNELQRTADALRFAQTRLTNTESAQNQSTTVTVKDPKTGKETTTQSFDASERMDKLKEEIAQLTGKMKQLEDNIIEHQTKNTRFDNLTAEQKYLTARQKELEEAEKTLSGNKATADADVKKYTGELTRAQADRAAREKELPQAYEKAFERSVDTYLDAEVVERYDRYEAAQAKARETVAARDVQKADEDRAELENEITKKLTEHYIANKRWKGSGRMTLRPRYLRTVLSHRIEADYNAIVYQENPDAILGRLGIDPKEWKNMRGFLTGKVIEMRREILYKNVGPVENQLLVAKQWYRDALPDMIKRNPAFKAALEEKLGDTIDPEKMPKSLVRRLLPHLRVDSNLVMLGLVATSTLTSMAKSEESKT